MRLTSLVPLFVAAALGGGPAGAGDRTGWGEPHLPIVPRTADEAERVAAITARGGEPGQAEKFETRPAGAATHFGLINRDAFSLPSANLRLDRALEFRVGNGFFRKSWVAAPASTRASDGLGPLFNARACQHCHRKDGRGHPPESPDDDAISMVFKLSLPGRPDPGERAATTPGASRPEPAYGSQLQDLSLPGIPAEGRLRVRTRPIPVLLEGGTEHALQMPVYSIESPAYGPLHPQTVVSPRVAPQMIGLGLLEAVPERDVLALADPDDRDGDGISGRPNRVWSRLHGQWMLGRFGHKAGSATLREQSANAFLVDMGLSTSLHPAGSGECTPAQEACLRAPDGAGADGLEVSDEALDLVEFYARNLAVPARRNADDPAVLRGKALFREAGCAACHTPKFVTHRLTDRPEQSFQLIWPYTDLLLHDMGPDLADGATEWDAGEREWRTPPLWGIGLTATVSGHTRFLHDGRARSLLEAVLWHGGEGEASREAVVRMPERDRSDLLRFLESL